MTNYFNQKQRVYEAMDSDKVALIKKLIAFGLAHSIEIGSDEAREILSNNDWDLDESKNYLRNSKGKKKVPKDKKVFKRGDIIVCVDPKPGKMPQDCVEYLLTYKKFKVLDVNDKLNIDIGHKLEENGNTYYFAPNRFELKDGIAPVRKEGGDEMSPTTFNDVEQKIADNLKNTSDIEQKTSEFLKKSDILKKQKDFITYGKTGKTILDPNTLAPKKITLRSGAGLSEFDPDDDDLWGDDEK